jgi:hypothetical protein
MIQTKQPIIYEDRGDKSSIVTIEIDSYVVNKEGYVLLVNDYVEILGHKECYKAKNVKYSNAQIDALSAYIDENFDLSGLSKTAKEWKKLQIALMVDTQTNLLNSGLTIYRLTPDDWEFTPEE